MKSATDWSSALGLGERNNSIPMRNFVPQLTSPVVRRGMILVGTIIMRPSGRGTSLPRLRTKVTRRWSLEPMT